MDGKELSYMMAVPKNVDDIMDADGIFERLENISDAELISRNVKQNKAEIDVVYKGVKYTVQFYVVAFNMPQMYRIQHLFPDLDAEAVENTEVGLGFIMEFSDNYLDSYHLQLKIIDAAVPEKLAVFDDSSEKVLSANGRLWRQNPLFLPRLDIFIQCRPCWGKMTAYGFTRTD